ncbi:MAG: type II toxin-antitoxin system HicA family toxin [Vulcanimicrobiaceae bacterium]
MVPMHAGQDVPPGTLRDILTRANLMADDLRDLL